jgi:copper(I)-binding protein
MKRITPILLAAILILSACSAATGVDASNAWIRPTGQGDNGAVYFLLENHSVGTDELTGISSDAAEAVEIHESQMENDVMQMRQVTSVSIKGKTSLEFSPGGYHVMLVNLKQTLNVGDEIELTLHFKKAGDVLLTVPVQDGPATDPKSEY